MAKASVHLTPVTLELGGKSPCIVEKSANLKLAARKNCILENISTVVRPV